MTATARRALLVLLVLGAVAFAGAYGYLVVSTANAPKGASLPSSSRSAGPSGSAVAGGSSQYNGADGPWVLPKEDAGFVGYRAREVLAVEWFRAPNDAVGRTTGVTGRLEISGTALTAADITADVMTMTSDEEPRDSHLREYLQLATYPTARFQLTKPVEIGAPQQGKPVSIDAPGTLQILDVTKPVMFPLQARWDGDSIAVAGAVAVRRSDFRMDVGQLLGFRVADEITIELELRFVRPCQEPCVAGSPGASPSAVASPGSSASASPASSPARPDRTARNVPAGYELGFTGIIETGADLPDTGIYVLGGSGAPRELVKRVNQMVARPTWSHDGRLLAFEESNLSSPPRLQLAGADGRDAREVSGGDLRQPEWSPDRRTLVAVPADDQRGALITVDVASGVMTTILEEQGGVDDTPDWSVDGRRIVFGRFVARSNNEDLWTIAPDGSGLRQLTRDPGYEYSPDWSPDGRRIAFIREGDVWVMAADGSGARGLTRGLKADSPAWSPDGRYIAFTVENDLWFMRADGSQKTKLELPFEIVSDPAWRPQQ